VEYSCTFIKIKFTRLRDILSSNSISILRSCSSWHKATWKLFTVEATGKVVVNLEVIHGAHPVNVWDIPRTSVIWLTG
jgi:hypothetical protein